MAENLITGDDGIVRCWWPGDNDDYRTYHDEEWGRPVVDDMHLFEKWESDEALAAHMKASHMAEFQQKAGDFGITAMSVERFDGATASKLI